MRALLTIAVLILCSCHTPEEAAQRERARQDGLVLVCRRTPAITHSLSAEQMESPAARWACLCARPDAWTSIRVDSSMYWNEFMLGPTELCKQ